MARLQLLVNQSQTHLHSTKPPSLDMVPCVRVQPHDAVVGDADDLVLAVPHEADHEQRLPVVWEVLPGLDVLQFGFEER